MSPANGHAQKERISASGPPPAVLAPGVLQVSAERVKELVAALEVPFDPSQIEWRVMNTTKGQQRKVSSRRVGRWFRMPTSGLTLIG